MEAHEGVHMRSDMQSRRGGLEYASRYIVDVSDMTSKFPEPLAHGSYHYSFESWQLRRRRHPSSEQFVMYAGARSETECFHTGRDDDHECAQPPLDGRKKRVRQ